jgi:1,2-diacylglycerol 3-beta-galactosyltransferase
MPKRPHRPVVELFFFDAGGGHRSAATALLQVMAQTHPHWQVSIVNLQELLQTVDPVNRFSKYQSQDIYNAILKRGWTQASEPLLRGLQQGIRLLAPAIEERLRMHWRKNPVDLVVSLIPNFNRAMFCALRDVRPATPYVTVMTDLADCPPHFWLEPQDQYVVCGTATAAQQASEMGYAADRIFQVSGMILKPQFYDRVKKSKPLSREALGLAPGIPTALIMFGGYSANIAGKIVKALRGCDSKLQTIVMCGHNEKLRHKLQGLKACHAVGFTSEVQSYMRLADFFIGKPGPGSISEALHMGLPVILERNRKTMLQEQYNTIWVEQEGVGLVVKKFKKQIADAVDQMLQTDQLSVFRHKAAQLNNQAVFEVPKIFESILDKGGRFPRI